MKTAVKSVGLALVAALTCGCAGSPSNEPYVQRVSLTRPELLGGETIRTFSGVVRAAHEVNLGFKTAGQIARIHVEEGDYVRRGELLAELDDADYRLAVEALQIQYDQLKDEVERTKQLFEQKSSLGTSSASRPMTSRRPAPGCGSWAYSCRPTATNSTIRSSTLRPTAISRR